MSISISSKPKSAPELIAPEWLAEFESVLRDLATPDEGCPAVLIDAIHHSLLAPCKRLRPTLLILATDACQGVVRDALPAACAVEMIHTYSLIHDDLRPWMTMTCVAVDQVATLHLAKLMPSLQEMRC